MNILDVLQAIYKNKIVLHMELHLMPFIQHKWRPINGLFCQHVIQTHNLLVLWTLKNVI